MEEIDADAFGIGTKLFPRKTVATDTEARLLRTRMDSSSYNEVRRALITVATALAVGVVADDDPSYYCDSDSDSYCEKTFPGTACISVDNYGDVISKFTTNTAKRSACREENLSGGDDCW
ncbi:hypothetical protein PsorP6_005507 [Peronosclerospora sorghi]|uniref:Uncharacterized protein n=1 Tax=Peronosclerospora sorghi TaxID=230839 RepID=A0ACC0W2I0_9STRA|nr:hypothetical protein PsorP6_005507 [Peronosclerospora sorghi]